MSNPSERKAATLRVVLLRPKRGMNVGAVCRAMKNMGVDELVVVGGEYDEEARRTAVHADDVFRSIRAAGTLDDALANATCVVATTSREIPWKLPVAPIDEVFSDVRSCGPEAHVALVLGPEDHGLSNEELARCHRIASIPTAGEYVSLNLAQAAVICLYEWMRSQRRMHGEPARSAGDGRATDGGARASDRAQSAAMADLADVLAEIGFLDGDQAERVMASIRSMLSRAGLDEREVTILRGIVRQIRWAARRGEESAARRR
jgi:tRNA/rRNA methyltransferase